MRNPGHLNGEGEPADIHQGGEGSGGGPNSTLTLTRATQGHRMPPASAFTAFQYVTAVLRQGGFLFLSY